MTRHVIDRNAQGALSQRADHYTRLENDGLPRPQTLQAQQRARQNDESARLARFLNIERMEGWAEAMRKK